MYISVFLTVFYLIILAHEHANWYLQYANMHVYCMQIWIPLKLAWCGYAYGTNQIPYQK